MKNPLIFMDFETSGLNPALHCIVQAAWIVEKDGRVLCERSFEVRPEDNDNLTIGALNVNGFTMDRLMAGKSISYVLTCLKHDILAARKGELFPIPVGHNIGFDLSFLTEAIRRNHEQYIDLDFYHALDTLAIARWYAMLGIINPGRYKLVDLCEYFGIPLQAHDALSDTRAARTLFHTFFNKTVSADHFDDLHSSFLSLSFFEEVLCVGR